MAPSLQGELRRIRTSDPFYFGRSGRTLKRGGQAAYSLDYERSRFGKRNLYEYDPVYRVGFRLRRFIRALRFLGYMPGYVFRMGVRGLGYYPDPMA